MTNFSPPRVSSHYSSTSSLVSLDDEDEVHTFSFSLGEDHKVTLIPSGEQRVSWGKKIWRFLTFANWRGRRSKTSAKGAVVPPPLTERKVEVGKGNVLQSKRKKWTEKLMNFFGLSKPLSDRGARTKGARFFRRKPLSESDVWGRVLFKLQYREEDGDYQNRVNALFRSKDDRPRAVRYQASRDRIEALMNLHVANIMYPQHLKQVQYEQKQVGNAFKQMDEAVGLPNFGDEVPPGETNYRNEGSWQDSAL